MFDLFYLFNCQCSVLIGTWAPSLLDKPLGQPKDEISMAFESEF